MLLFLVVSALLGGSNLSRLSFSRSIVVVASRNTPKKNNSTNKTKNTTTSAPFKNDDDNSNTKRRLFLFLSRRSILEKGLYVLVLMIGIYYVERSKANVSFV
jgi:hypothetical protein